MENSFVSSIVAVLSLIALAGIVYPFRPFKKRWHAFVAFIGCFIVFGIVSPETQTSVKEAEVLANPDRIELPEGSDKLWVTTDRLNRRTCPSEVCGVVGQLFFREGVDTYENRDGWARITKYYDASCVNGQSEYVDDGNSLCEVENGISEGKFAEWVFAEFLSEDRPPDPSSGATGLEALIAGSDDFRKYRSSFSEAAQTLIGSGRCSEADFLEWGGWMKSSNHRDQPIYFTYCGGSTTSHRLYLNVETREIFR